MPDPSPFVPVEVGNGWWTNPEGGLTKIYYPHGIHGGAMIRTLPPDRVYPYADEAGGVDFGKLKESIRNLSDSMRQAGQTFGTMFAAGLRYSCGPKPRSVKFYRVKADGKTPSDELTKRRKWRKCKRALTQRKEARQPRGERY